MSKPKTETKKEPEPEIFDTWAYEQKNPDYLDKVPDLSQLIHLEGPNVIHVLRCRYAGDEIYTSISKVLIAINPYKSIPIYSGSLIETYRKRAKDRRNVLPPHVFTVSQGALYNLTKYQTNQSMVVCGESGSGKTESAKHLMRYLAYSSDSLESQEESKATIEKQVLDANPILESFGNAKTFLNNNSSRFGKFTKIVFGGSSQEKIVGSFIETYLLEKSRVVQQDKSERNYHVFYQLVSGAMGPERMKEYGLTQADDFHYLNQSGCIIVEGHDDKQWFHTLTKALSTLGFDDKHQEEIFRLVCGILHMGNIEFAAAKGDGSVVEEGSQQALDLATKMFQVDKARLTKRLLTRTIAVRGQAIETPMAPDAASANRDAMAKALYNSNFNYIVSRINEVLYPTDARNTDLKWIGILDVFGFESFENNSFEQFCINFCNERLQQYFNIHIIKAEQDEYLQEAIFWKVLKVPDNQDVIDLIDKKVSGILTILDSACKMPKATDEILIRNIVQLHPYHPRLKTVDRVRKAGQKGLTPMNGFSIRHYAGVVVYNAKEFLGKNNDSTNPETNALFGSSKSKVVSMVLTQSETYVGPAAGKGGGSSAGKESQTTFKSVGSVFSSQLESLMRLLYQTTPYFVRCIKPNSLKKHSLFDSDYVRPQLECGGIIEALRILKLGYPSRCTYAQIFDRYGSILRPTPPNLNKRDFCEAILRNVGETLDRAEFQLGLSKVFFRPGKQEFLENILAEGGELPARTVLAIKAFLLNKRFQRGRGAIRVHIGFTLRLLRTRALRRVHRAMRVTLVFVKTMFKVLRRVRRRHASKVLQGYIRSTLAMAKYQRLKSCATSVGNFYFRLRRRKKLVKELNKRIDKRRTEMKEQERLAMLKREEERKNVALREAREREERRQKEENERADRLRQEKERERVLAEQREKERVDAIKKVEEDRERQRLEMEARIAAAQLEAQKQAEERERDRLRREQEAKEEVERLMMQLKLRELELTEREKIVEKQQATVPVVVAGADSIIKLLVRGAGFLRLILDETSKESGHRILLSVSEDGLLGWSKDTEDIGLNPGHKQALPPPTDTLALVDIEAIGLGMFGKKKAAPAAANATDKPPANAPQQPAANAPANPPPPSTPNQKGGPAAKAAAASPPESAKGKGPAAKAGADNKQQQQANGATPNKGQGAAANAKTPPPVPPPMKIDPATNAPIPETSPRRRKKGQEEADAEEKEAHAEFVFHIVTAEVTLTLQARDTNTRDLWVTALRYSVRNMKELGSIGRPEGDAARGNILAAQYMDKIIELSNKLAVYEANGGRAPAGGLADDATVVALQAKIQELMKQNQQLMEGGGADDNGNIGDDEVARRVNKARKSVLNAGTVVLFQEKMKLKQLQQKYKEAKEKMVDLQTQNEALQEQLETLGKGGVAVKKNPNVREEQVKRDVNKKVRKAKKSVIEAETEVVEAEVEVKKRQDVIRNAMKSLQEKENALNNTKATMQVLGIKEGDPASYAHDATAKRLAELKKQQEKEQEECKSVLLKEYAAMVAVAESLNEKNEALAEKVYTKQQYEKVERGLVTPQPEIRKTQGKDDGCVIS